MTRWCVAALTALLCGLFLNLRPVIADPIRFGPAMMAFSAFDATWTPTVEVTANLEGHPSTAQGHFVVTAVVPKEQLIQAIRRSVQLMQPPGTGITIADCAIRIVDAPTIDVQMIRQTAIIDAVVTLQSDCLLDSIIPHELSIHVALAPDVRRGGRVGLNLGQLKIDPTGLARVVNDMAGLIHKDAASLAEAKLGAKLRQFTCALPSTSYGQFAVQGASLSKGDDGSISIRVTIDSLHTQAQLTALLRDAVRTLSQGSVSLLARSSPAETSGSSEQEKSGTICTFD